MIEENSHQMNLFKSLFKGREDVSLTQGTALKTPGRRSTDAQQYD
jgi:hypothetical protein